MIPKQVSLRDAAELLSSGLIGVIPTDTVYGVVALASNKDAVNRLYKLKSRQNKPGTLLAANVNQLAALGLKKEELGFASRFWPNPVSIILSASDDLKYLHQGIGSLAVRIPDDASLREVLESGPLVSSSANLPGLTPATSIEEAYNYFKDNVDFYVDGGDLSGRVASTIATLENGKLTVIRQGAFTPKE